MYLNKIKLNKKISFIYYFFFYFLTILTKNENSFQFDIQNLGYKVNTISEVFYKE